MISHLAFLSGHLLGDRAALFSRHLRIKENINEDIKKILMISIQMSPWSTLVSRPVWAHRDTAPWPPGCTPPWAPGGGCCSTPASPPACTPPWAPAWPPAHTPDNTQLRCHDVIISLCMCSSPALGPGLVLVLAPGHIPREGPAQKMYIDVWPNCRAYLLVCTPPFPVV